MSQSGSDRGFWSAASAFIEHEGRDSADLKDRVAEAVRDLAALPSEASVYVAKLTAGGMNNQVWQGRSLTATNEVMVFFAPNLQSSLGAARERLVPLARNGFDSVVIARQDEGDWSIHHVIEYREATVGEGLLARTEAEFQITKLADPALPRVPPMPIPPQMGAATDVGGVEAPLDAGEVLLHLREFKNVILEGPPGTGKTTLAFDVAASLAGGDPAPYRLETILQGRSVEESATDLASAPLVWEVAQFHPGFGYEDFVRGIRTDPEQAGFFLKSFNGLLVRMAEAAALRPGKISLLIIDEINRGNLAATLGETIFAIDPSHRGRPIRLQYEAPDGGARDLVVPPELYIVATMNTADRTLAAFDFAVRRRFRFLRVDPSAAVLAEFYNSQPARGRLTSDLLKELASAVRDPELIPGHSYLMLDPDQKLTDEKWVHQLGRRVQTELKPLLDEYRVEGLPVGEIVRNTTHGPVNLLTDTADLVSLALTEWLATESSEASS